MSTPYTAESVANRTHAIFALLMLLWCAIWLFKSGVDMYCDWFQNTTFTAVFWLIAKTIAWIFPACVLIQASGRDFYSVFNLKEWRRWCYWGTIVGLLIASTGFLPKAITGQPLLLSKFDYGTLNVLLIAPLFEEFLIRAAILSNLIPLLGFVRANVIASFYFVVLHIPGWYMMGNLQTKLTLPIGGALSIFFLGLLFGWVSHKSRSFLGGSIAHCLNNLAA
jgi:membrane protease YdiL (CAAX protease family)